MRWIIVAIILPIFFSFVVPISVDAKENSNPAPVYTSEWIVITLPDGALD